MLEIRNLTVDYGAVRALDQVTLSAREGTVTAVLGANGAGKTTLLRTISGLVKPTAGSIVFVGREISGRPAEDIARLGLGHVPEGQGVILELTVEENLRLGGLIAPGGSRERRATADRVYALFPALVECRDRLASTLSGGERRMLVIGRALMGGLGPLSWTNRRWAWHLWSLLSSWPASANCGTRAGTRWCWLSRTHAVLWPSPTDPSCSIWAV